MVLCKSKEVFVIVSTYIGAVLPTLQIIAVVLSDCFKKFLKLNLNLTIKHKVEAVKTSKFIK